MNNRKFIPILSIVTASILSLLFVLSPLDAIESYLISRLPNREIFSIPPVHAETSEVYLEENAAVPGDNLRIIKNPSQQTIVKGDDVEFTIIVLNSSNKVDLVDVVVSDPLVPACNRFIGNLPANSNFPPYQCVVQDVNAPFTNEIFVTGKNPLNGKSDKASDTAKVDLIGIDVNLTPDRLSMVEPGGVVSFTLSISNSGNIDVSLTSLISDPFGDLTNPKNPLIIDNNCLPNPSLPELLAGIGSTTCSFSAVLVSQPGVFHVQVDAIAEAGEQLSIIESGFTEIDIINSPAALEVSLTANPSKAYIPKQDVYFSTRITNTSAIDEITINNISASFLGSLDGIGSCTLPQTISAGESYLCDYNQEISGKVGDEKIFKVFVEGEDDDVPAGDISAIGEVVINFIKPPFYSLFLPLITNDQDEPNNRCQEAYPITLNRPYWFMANDLEDWYYFEISQPGNLDVILSNFKPRFGQIVIYQGGSCSSLKILKNNGNDQETKTVPLGIQQPGRYYVRIHNDGPMNKRDPYKLEITYQPD